MGFLGAWQKYFKDQNTRIAEAYEAAPPVIVPEVKEEISYLEKLHQEVENYVKQYAGYRGNRHWNKKDGKVLGPIHYENDLFDVIIFTELTGKKLDPFKYSVIVPQFKHEFGYNTGSRSCVTNNGAFIAIAFKEKSLVLDKHDFCNELEKLVSVLEDFDIGKELLEEDFYRYLQVEIAAKGCKQPCNSIEDIRSTKVGLKDIIASSIFSEIYKQWQLRSRTDNDIFPLLIPYVSIDKQTLKFDLPSPFGLVEGFDGPSFTIVGNICGTPFKYAVKIPLTDMDKYWDVEVITRRSVEKYVNEYIFEHCKDLIEAGKLLPVVVI